MIGQASEFPPESVIEVVLDVGHFDPFGLESPLAEFPTGRKFSDTRLLVVSDSEGQGGGVIPEEPVDGMPGRCSDPRQGHRIRSRGFRQDSTEAFSIRAMAVSGPSLGNIWRDPVIGASAAFLSATSPTVQWSSTSPEPSWPLLALESGADRDVPLHAIRDRCVSVRCHVHIW